jgi:hypothetical protein
VREKKRIQIIVNKQNFFKMTSQHAAKGDGVFARKGLLVMATCYTFLFVGALFGWGPMEVMMEDAGAFASLCLPDEKLPCKKQSETIINIGMIAICTNM